MRLALCLSLVAAGCAATPPGAGPRGDCFEIEVSAAARDALWFQGLPAVIELTDEVLPDLQASDGPQPYRRARSWPRTWDRTEPLTDSDPIGAWRRAGWRRAAGGWTDDGDAADSLVVDIGPYAIAFAGFALTLARDGSAVGGRAVSFTDVIVNGEPPFRDAPVTGRRVRCPAAAAHLDRQPYRS